MAKINKVYPSFFNGVSQQTPEFVLDSQCKEMVNCVPDIVKGLTKRPPVKHTATLTLDNANGHTFHTYDRGEDQEEYFFIETHNAADPIKAYSRAGTPMVITYETADATALKAYLSLGDLRGLTVQDRTWIFSKSAGIDIDYTDPATDPLKVDYTKEAYFWLKRGSGDRYNPFNYAVYLNSRTFEVAPDKPASDNNNPVLGAEDSTVAAQILAKNINEGRTFIDRYSYTGPSTAGADPRTVNIGAGKVGAEVLPVSDGITVSGVSYNNTTGDLSFTVTTTVADQKYEVKVNQILVTDFKASVLGSVLKITYEPGSVITDFNFSSWDSWGNQASESWKGSVNKITDLPKDMPFQDVYVELIGTGESKATNYFVKWNGSAWEECLDPAANRGKLTNMPIKMDRIDLTAGVATFEVSFVDWSTPRVGNTENNPDPSFVVLEPSLPKATVQDMFFYKNRLGIASENSIVLSETANYTNWYAATANDILDTDVIDITIASNQASKIHYVKPFNNSLYIFTKYAQYELVNEGAFGPATVSLNNATNYPMETDVEPVVVNNSLYFISNTDNRQQLREYIKTQSLNVKGVDLNIGTPTYLQKPIKHLLANGVLGYVICGTADNTLYLYNYKEDGEDRIQSAWSTWEALQFIPEDPLNPPVDLTGYSFEYHMIESKILVFAKTGTTYRYHQLQLDYNVPNDNVDTSSLDGITIDNYPYEAKVKLPDYYPKLTEIKTPLNKVLIKKVSIEGEGSFDAEVYRKDYNTTYSKSHLRSLRDLNLHVASKVGNVEVTLKDSTADDFVISSVVLEGLFNATSREMR